MVRSSGFELVLKNLSWVYVIPKYQILKNSTGNIQIHPESINISIAYRNLTSRLIIICFQRL